ncbi:MAG: hypothetical protein KDK62_04275 [Chlamydiia bacterium]|nr:hypothetical protein [Chlamydiia bacterium]
MKKNIAILLVALSNTLFGLDMEVTGAYDYFRSLPEGSWNGNNGAYVSLNTGAPVLDFLDFQLGGSFGIYNWDGQDNIVFENTSNPMYQGFITTGFTYKENQYTLGLVYDWMFTSNYTVFNVAPAVDQLRGKFGYQMCNSEIGVWGTYRLDTSTKNAQGLPVKFRAISQASVFITHRFSKCAQGTVWLGVPTDDGLMESGKKPGEILAGFEVRAPLGPCLFLDAHGSYLRAREYVGCERTRNYQANITVGITYLFGDRCQGMYSTYQPVANNSNFLLDTNINL